MGDFTFPPSYMLPILAYKYIGEFSLNIMYWTQVILDSVKWKHWLFGYAEFVVQSTAPLSTDVLIPIGMQRKIRHSYVWHVCMQLLDIIC